MNEVNHLDGLIYHMVHIKNLQSIFQQGMLLSKMQMLQQKNSYESIAYEQVQSLRDRVFLWSIHYQKYRSLHCYVPFYFATRTPMLYVQFKKDIQDQIVILEASRSILQNQGVLFTDGNASNQQLSLGRGEKVGIVPATRLATLCQRRYYPGGPYGTNFSRSDFFGDISFLGRLKWDVIEDEWFRSEEAKRIKHAEVLVPDSFPLSLIQNIAVSTKETAQVVNNLSARYRNWFYIPPVTYKPSLFFH